MESKIKCFSDEHKEIDAISFCPECKIYMCNKCDNFHSSFFKNHHSYNYNKDDEIFTGLCKEKNHPNKLRYYCKNHNQLCCVTCLCKLNEEGEGQHKDCDVCYIEKIKEEKKNKLKENIKYLEDMENKFNENIKELKEIIQNIEKDKENLKIEIQKVFKKIRNAINDREDKLLIEVDNFFNDNYFDEDIINKGEKLPKQIKLSLEKGKLIDKEWDNNNIYSYINDCINIENNIKIINKINERIKNYKINNKQKIKFIQKDSKLNDFLDKIKSFGKISYHNKYSLRNCPLNTFEKRKFIITGENNNIIIKTSENGYYSGTICEKELDKSIEEHKWKIKILKSKSKDIMVGISTNAYNFSEANYDTCGYYLNLCSSPKLYSGPPYNYSNLNTILGKINDELIIVMNMKKRALKFVINNEDKGDSYTNIPIDKPLFPAIILYNQNDSVEIKEI